jgi:hypothetical protein
MIRSTIGEIASARKPGLDDLLTELFCVLDDELPRQRMGRPRATTDAEIVCLAVAQMLLDCPRERAWLRRAPRRVGHLFPRLPSHEQYNRRLRGLRAVLVRAIGLLALHHRAVFSEILLIDTTCVPVSASRETVQRSDLAGSAAYGYTPSHSRYYWGYKLVLMTSPEGYPVGFDLVAANTGDTAAARAVMDSVPLAGCTVIGDRGFRGSEQDFADHGATLLRPLFRHERQRRPERNLSRVRQWIESIIWTLKGHLSLERHGARTVEGVAARVAARLLALGAALWFNGLIGQPGRHLTAYDH